MANIDFVVLVFLLYGTNGYLLVLVQCCAFFLYKAELVGTICHCQFLVKTGSSSVKINTFG